jgi:hypothetical protein
MTKLHCFAVGLLLLATTGIAWGGVFDDLMDAHDHPNGPAAQEIRQNAWLTSPSRCTTQLCRDHLYDDVWQKVNKLAIEKCDRYPDLCADVKAGRR